MYQKMKYGCSRQRGIALPVIMIILVLAALVTIYTTTTSVKEQQVTADQYRSEQAFSTAQAGVDTALERHNHFETFTVDGCGNTVPPETDVTSDCTDFSGSEKGTFKVMFCDIWDEDDDDPNVDGDDLDTDTSASLMADFLADTVECENPLISELDPDGNTGNGFQGDERVGILSVGKPDDASGRRTISVVSAPGFTIDRVGFNFLPLSARGSIGVTGSITVINRYRNLTMWSGDDLDFGSAAVETFINDGTLVVDDEDYSGTSDEHRLAMTDVTMTPSLLNAQLASNNKVGHNSDAITGDANLSELEPDVMFKQLFSKERDIIKGILDESGLVYEDIGAVSGESGIMWVDALGLGSISLDDNVGTFETPAFLIVELDPNEALTLTANAVIYGQVFVFGDVNLTGGPVIYGSVVATEDVGKGAGGGTIVYDPDGLVSGSEGLAGLRGIEPGTWKDWGYVK